MLEKAFETNDDGFGIAWREPARDGVGMEVVWKKGIDEIEEVIHLCDTVPVPYVAHFRAASAAFPVRPSLTHPFEVSEHASYALEGRTKGGVLFHNGTWDSWDKVALDVAARSGVGIPTGPFSDTRGIAWLTNVMGEGFMNFLPQQRGVLFKTDGWEVFSGPGWKRVTDLNGHTFWCSNDRPWPAGNTNTAGQGKVSGHMCYAPRCIVTENLDAEGHCPAHPGGKLIKEALVVGQGKNALPFDRAAIKVGPGGAPTTPLPFRQTAQGPLISVEQAEIEHKAGRFTKGLVKEIQDCYSRMASGKPQRAAKAHASLVLATQLLTLYETETRH